MIEEIVNWIKNYVVINKIEALVVGISGGIDSAVVSTLCSMTMIKTIVVSIPIEQKKNQLERAHLHFDWLKSKFDNVIFIEKDMTDIFHSFKQNFLESEKSDLSLANSKSRLRMMTLYQIAGAKNGIVVGTGNKIEDFGVGFFTKYGDGAVDISPIADLTKTEVRNIASELHIIEEIQIAKPTDGLWEEDKTDEDQLGASYDELEWAMFFNGDINILTDRQIQVLEIYKNHNNKNKHKMEPIPIFRKSIL